MRSRIASPAQLYDRGRFTSGILEEVHHRRLLVSFAVTKAAFAEAESATAAGPDTPLELDEDEEAEVEAARCVLEACQRAAAARAAAAEQRRENLTQKRAAGRAVQEAHTVAKRVKRAKG